MKSHYVFSSNTQLSIHTYGQIGSSMYIVGSILLTWLLMMPHVLVGYLATRLSVWYMMFAHGVLMVHQLVKAGLMRPLYYVYVQRIFLKPLCIVQLQFVLLLCMGA